MVLSAEEVSLARERMLDNMLELSFACLESARQLTVAVAAAGRSGFLLGGEHWSQLVGLKAEVAAQHSAAFVLDHVAQAGSVFEEAVRVFSETQKTVIRCSETQVRILDAMAVAAIERIRKTTPWEAEPALDALSDSLVTTAQAVHQLSEAAIGMVDRLENGVRDAVVAKPNGRPAV